MLCEPKSTAWLRQYFLKASKAYKGLRTKNLFSYFSTKTYVVGTQNNCLNETVLWAPKTHV